MSLSLLIILPLVTAILILFCKGLKQVRTVALSGAVLQLVLAFVFLAQYWQLRAAGDLSTMLFEEDYTWFAPLNIHYHIGVDGISISMILLTAFVSMAGILVSWQMEKLSKEFFFLLMFLGMGAYGFFISLDLFTLFFFLEVAVIPKFLLIGIWGSGAKEYSAMKLALMLMGGSALVFVGLAGLYFNTDVIFNPNVAGDTIRTFDLLQIAQSPVSTNAQMIFFPFAFIGFGIFTALFPFHTWVPDGHSSAPTAASMFLAGISMKLGGYGCLRVQARGGPGAGDRADRPAVVRGPVGHEARGTATRPRGGGPGVRHTAASPSLTCPDLKAAFRALRAGEPGVQDGAGASVGEFLLRRASRGRLWDGSAGR
jgi:NADH-quinone oxidoreductase subunit M